MLHANPVKRNDHDKNQRDPIRQMKNKKQEAKRKEKKEKKITKTKKREHICKHTYI